MCCYFISTLLLILPSITFGSSEQKDERKYSGWNLWKGEVPISVEATMNTPEIIRYRGYPVEIHQVITDDDYILEMHRIPHGKSVASQSFGRPIFLQHGLFGASSNWIISSSNQSLAFQLADLGYDVWLGNFRGNTYSTNHLYLNPNQRPFWRFSYDEMGKLDIPAMINYVLNQTGHQKLSYVGHSMGCAAFFIAMITHPQLNSKIDVMVAMAPAVAVSNTKSALFFAAAPVLKEIQLLFKIVNGRDFFPVDSLSSRFTRLFCNKNVKQARKCRNFIFLLFGFDTYNLPLDLIPTIDYHYPAGTSIQTYAQYVQNYKTGTQTLIHYDFGPLENERKYGQLQPPVYDLKQVACRVNIFYALNDFVVIPKDALWVSAQLPNVNQTIRVEDPLFNHMDFVWAKDVNRLVYDQLISMLSPPATAL